MELVRVRALRPVVGAYPCEDVGVADHISKVLERNENGQIVEARAAYKKFRMTVETTRPASEADIEDDKERKRIAEVTGSEYTPKVVGQSVIEPADPEYLDMPKSYAEGLAERGIVEIISGGGKLKRKAIQNNG